MTMAMTEYVVCHIPTYTYWTNETNNWIFLLLWSYDFYFSIIDLFQVNFNRPYRWNSEQGSKNTVYRRWGYMIFNDSRLWFLITPLNLLVSERFAITKKQSVLLNGFTKLVILRKLLSIVIFDVFHVTETRKSHKIFVHECSPVR